MPIMLGGGIGGIDEAVASIGGGTAGELGISAARFAARSSSSCCSFRAFSSAALFAASSFCCRFFSAAASNAFRRRSSSSCCLRTASASSASFRFCSAAAFSEAALSAASFSFCACSAAAFSSFSRFSFSTASLAFLSSSAFLAASTISVGNVPDALPLPPIELSNRLLPADCARLSFSVESFDRIISSRVFCSASSACSCFAICSFKNFSFSSSSLFSSFLRADFGLIGNSSSSIPNPPNPPVALFALPGLPRELLAGLLPAFTLLNFAIGDCSLPPRLFPPGELDRNEPLLSSSSPGAFVFLFGVRSLLFSKIVFPELNPTTGRFTGGGAWLILGTSGGSNCCAVAAVLVLPVLPGTPAFSFSFSSEADRCGATIFSAMLAAPARGVTGWLEAGEAPSVPDSPMSPFCTICTLARLTLSTNDESGDFLG
mmetsp:Transcript_3875/g.9424  ORF Transcript_3875/g.9424 Transcript_3875/m.9424 type:complete len:431 (+) Transcript_3875:1672-2964(+)